MINVFQIERFATHDGPGIRTTVFLKGCSLHCPWCANPESWSLRPVRMYHEKRCTACGRCVQACPVQAIRIEDGISYEEAACIRCQRCMQVCPSEAVTFAGRQMTIEEVMAEVKKDTAYYENSGGGVTISGGEPFVQFAALKKLLKALKKEGLHTAVETTGNYPLAQLREVLADIDLFLFDVKHLDADILREVTGGKAAWILENLSYLAGACPDKVIVRIPVIPGFNDEDALLKRILDHVAGQGLKRADLLPYHTLGKTKWEQMGKRYALQDTRMMDRAHLKLYADYGRSRQLLVRIGG